MRPWEKRGLSRARHFSTLCFHCICIAMGHIVSYLFVRLYVQDNPTAKLRIMWHREKILEKWNGSLFQWNSTGSSFLATYLLPMRIFSNTASGQRYRLGYLEGHKVGIFSTCIKYPPFILKKKKEPSSMMDQRRWWWSYGVVTFIWSTIFGT